MRRSLTERGQHDHPWLRMLRSGASGVTKFRGLLLSLSGRSLETRCLARRFLRRWSCHELLEREETIRTALDRPPPLRSRGKTRTNMLASAVAKFAEILQDTRNSREATAPILRTGIARRVQCAKSAVARLGSDRAICYLAAGPVTCAAWPEDRIRLGAGRAAASCFERVDLPARATRVGDCRRGATSC